MVHILHDLGAVDHAFAALTGMGDADSRPRTKGMPAAGHGYAHSCAGGGYCGRVQALTTGQLMLAAALIFGLAATCQVIAPKLRMPALILLLPVGFLLGVVAPQFRVDAILGAAFPVIVDLLVAVILFQGGMELSAIPLHGKERTVVHRLLWLGATMTWLGAAALAYLLLGMEWSIALMLGAILIVSGPTVVTPILNFARPNARVRGILLWEGTILDPVGGLFAIVVFQVVKASSSATPFDAFVMFVTGILVAIVTAAFGVLLAVVGGRLTRGNTLLGTQVLLGSVIVAAGLANSVTDDSGLLTALIMGIVIPRVARRLGASLSDAKPFFDTIVAVGIGVLFVSIAALVPAETVGQIVGPAVAMALVLILVVRPLVAAICTAGSGIPRNARAYIACMDPRGIVAAATASSVGASLVALQIPGAQDILPAAFVIIAVTVTVYGLSAVPMARLLKVRETDEPAPAAAASPGPS